MSETKVEISEDLLSDLQYERYNHIIGKIALFGYAILDSAALISYEVVKNQTTESLAKITLITTIIGVTPLIMSNIIDEYRHKQIDQL